MENTRDRRACLVCFTAVPEEWGSCNSQTDHNQTARPQYQLWATLHEFFAVEGSEPPNNTGLCQPELCGEARLLKTPHMGVAGHRETKLELSWKLPPAGQLL